MLLAKRCPRTGVVNYFADHDPHVAIGSIHKLTSGAKADGKASYAWRCYTADNVPAGAAPDLETAESCLLHVFDFEDRTDRVVHC